MRLTHLPGGWEGGKGGSGSRPSGRLWCHLAEAGSRLRRSGCGQGALLGPSPAGGRGGLLSQDAISRRHMPRAPPCRAERVQERVAWARVLLVFLSAWSGWVGWDCRRHSVTGQGTGGN